EKYLTQFLSINNNKIYNLKNKCGVILFDEQQQVLLVRNRECKKWGLPKGSMEPNENLIECAFRETKEESGIDLYKFSPSCIVSLINIERVYYLIVKIPGVIKNSLKPIDTQEIIEA